MVGMRPPQKKRRQRLTVATAFAGLLLAGCGAGSPASPGEAASAEVDVLAAFYPFEYVARTVGGDRVTVENLTKPGAEPHDLELSPQQVAAVGEADLLIYEKGFQPAVDEAVEQEAPGGVLEVTEVVPLEDTGVEDEHADGEEDAEEDEHAEDEHAGDPHIWLDPMNLAEIGDATAERLGQLDPDGAQSYRDNAAALRADLEQLDRDFREGLASCERDTFVVSHEAFGYLAAAYGLEQVGISGLSPEAEPSPGRIAEVEEIVRSEGVTTIFYETLVSPKVAQTMATDLGVRTAVLDPLEGLAADAEGDYLTVMRNNLAALREANGCS